MAPRSSTAGLTDATVFPRGAKEEVVVAMEVLSNTDSLTFPPLDGGDVGVAPLWFVRATTGKRRTVLPHWLRRSYPQLPGVTVDGKE